MSKTYSKASKKGNRKKFKKQILDSKKKRLNLNGSSKKKNQFNMNNLLNAVEEEYLELVNATDVYEEDYSSEELISENEMTSDMESEEVDNLDLEGYLDLESEEAENAEEEPVNDDNLDTESDSNLESEEAESSVQEQMNDVSVDDVIDQYGDDEEIITNTEETISNNDAAQMSDIEQTTNKTNQTNNMNHTEEIKNESIDSCAVEEMEVLETPEKTAEIPAIEANELKEEEEEESNDFYIDEVSSLLSSSPSSEDIVELTPTELLERNKADEQIQDTDDQMTLEEMNDFYNSEELFINAKNEMEADLGTSKADVTSDAETCEDEIVENDEVTSIDESADDDAYSDSSDQTTTEQEDEISQPIFSESEEETNSVYSEEDGQEDLKNEECEDNDAEQYELQKDGELYCRIQVNGGIVEVKVKSFEQGRENEVLEDFLEILIRQMSQELKNGEEVSIISSEVPTSEDTIVAVASNPETETSDSEEDYNSDSQEGSDSEAAEEDSIADAQEDSNSDAEEEDSIAEVEEDDSNSDANSNPISNELTEEDVKLSPEIKDSCCSAADVMEGNDKCECEGCLFYDQSTEDGNEEVEVSNDNAVTQEEESTCLCNLDCPNYPKEESQIEEEGEDVPSEELVSTKEVDNEDVSLDDVDNDKNCVSTSDNSNSGSSSSESSTTSSGPVVFTMAHHVFGDVDVVASTDGNLYYNAVMALKAIGVSQEVTDNLPQLQENYPKRKEILFDHGQEYVHTIQYWPVSLILKTAFEDRNRQRTDMTTFSLKVMFPLLKEILGIRKDYSDLDGFNRSFAHKMDEYLWKVYLYLPSLVIGTKGRVDDFYWSE